MIIISRKSNQRLDFNVKTMTKPLLEQLVSSILGFSLMTSLFKSTNHILPILKKFLVALEFFYLMRHYVIRDGALITSYLFCL